jgi:hypothetical protein
MNRPALMPSFNRMEYLVMLPSHLKRMIYPVERWRDS